MRISVLGPEDTYSDEMAREYNPRADIQYHGSFSEVVGALAADESDEAIIPIENAASGNITEALDALREHRWSRLLVTDVPRLAVRHVLWASPDYQPGHSVTSILSRQQALTQCEAYLKSTYPDVPQIPVDSTTTGMDMIASGEAKRSLAIGPAKAGTARDLKVVERDIQDADTNETEFLVLNKNHEAETKIERTYIAVLPRGIDRPGRLARALTIIEEKGINLCLVESRSYLPILGSHLHYVGMEDVGRTDPRYPEIADEMESEDISVQKLTA